MRGLIAKAWIETRYTTLGFGLAAGITTAIVTLVLPQLAGGLEGLLLEVPMIRSMISAMMGVDVGTQLTTATMLSVLWTHPVVLALLWSHAIILCAAYPAGEIEMGTIDVLLGWPVSRRQAWRAHTLVWVASGLIVIAVTLAGYGLATLRLAADARPPTARVLTAGVNLLALYLATGGITLVASALASSQRRATAAGFALVAGSFLLNFLSSYSSLADALSFLGLMAYYRPALILRDGSVPVAHIAVLLSIAGVAWFAGMEISARRDIKTT